MKIFWSSWNAAVAVLFGACLLLCCSDDTEVLPPEVTSINPTSGSKTTVVTIVGTNFSTSINENEVTFNGKAAVVTAATATQLTVTVPPAADSGPVMVTKKGKNASNQPVFTFQWLVSTVAGTTGGYVDGAAAKFNVPSGVAADKDGNLLITDFANHVIRKVSANGLVSTVTGSVPGIDDGPIATAKLYFPNGSATDAEGNVYISEEGANRVRKITPAGQVSTLAGSTKAESGSTDGTGASAKFFGPSGIALDGQGNVYVADQSNHSIRKISPAGIVTTLAGGTSGSADGTGTAAQFNRPVGVVVDASGNVYVGDLFNHRIRKITASGVVSTIAGSSYGFADGSGPAAKFAYPAGLALDKQGNLYVADTENQRIRKITPEGVVSTLAGSATAGTVDGLAASAQFNAPREIDIDADGNIYVVDSGSHRVRKLD